MGDDMWIVRNNEFSHYGVLGMKWGVRKDQDKSSTKSRKSKTDRTLYFETDLTKTQVTLNGTNTLDDYRKQIEDLGITERTNFYMPKAIASKKLQNLPKIENKGSDEEDVLKVNDPTESKNRTTNCFQCTIAYEMRHRGYDVQANTNYGGHNFEYLHAFDVLDSFSVKTKSKTDGDYTPTSEETAAQCFDRIASQCLLYGDGASGAITMNFPLGGGHVMNWVVEDGEFKLIDAQRGGEDGYETFTKSTFDVEVFRLDNAELLPGSTDFVEPYKSPDDTIQKKVTNLIKTIGENVSKFVSDGLDFVKNFFKKK